MSFLLGFFLILIFLGLFVFLLIVRFFSNLFNFGRKKNMNQTDQRETDFTKNSRRGKVFEKSEGEYVDYEEVKD